MQDAVRYDVVNITSIIQLINDFDSKISGRPINTSKSLGWYPLVGITDKVKTENTFSQIYDDADPYLTSAKNHINGSYELYLGTPGRQGEVQKKVNGTTHTSLLYNNSHYAEKKARDQYRKDNPDATEAELAAAVEKYRLSQTNSKGDSGSIVADHISWAGVLTQEVHGDDCKLVNGTYARTIDGDYHLKITGIQYENSYQQQSNSGLELTFNAESSIQIVTPHILELINTENPTSNKQLVGKRTVVNGGVEIMMKPTKASDYYVSLTNTKASYKQIIPDSYTIKRGSATISSV